MRTYLMALLMVLSFSAMAQNDNRPGSVLKCISGDCANGIGEAQLSDVNNNSGDVYYKGSFKNGKMDGEGIEVVGGNYYVGHFKEGFKNGHLTVFNARVADGKYYPDSAGKVSFANYTSEYGFKSIIVKPDGTTENFSKHEGHYKESFQPFGPVKDKWINEQVAAYQALRAEKFAAPVAPPKPTAETMVLAVRKANVARDQWIEAIQWDCLPDRKYYTDVTALTKYHQLPFGGHLTMQVVAPDNTVAFEAETGTYWTPRTAGKYTFLIKFYQDKIAGGITSDYVDGFKIEWELKSKRTL